MGSIVASGALKVPKDHHKLQGIINNLTFINPFEPNKNFIAYFISPEYLVIPRGYPLTDEVDSSKLIKSHCDFETAQSYNLRDYQEVAVGEIITHLAGNDYGQLLLSAGTGSGKTTSLAGVLVGVHRRTLILSHLTMLSTQMFKEMTKNLPDASIKILEASDHDKQLPDVAIATFQLLNSSKKLLDSCKAYYGMVIVDEADNSFTSSRLKVLFTLMPQYQLYLTATPTKDLMKQTQGLNYLFGNKVVEMEQPTETVIHSRHLFLDYSHLTWQSPGNTNMYKTSLGKFILRSSIPSDIARMCRELKENNVKGTFWIIADLNAVQDKLEELLVAQGLTVGIIRGTTSQKKRQVILEAIHLDRMNILIGSAPLSAGISIPELSIGIRLMPNSSSEELLEQQKGRLKRFIEWKTTQSPLWIDFRISGNLEYSAKKRWKLYQETTHGVTMCKPHEVMDKIKGLIYDKQ